MTYCPECGSEVAELDIFCPYCGITLAPVPVAGAGADDEMASTIVMSLPKKAAVGKDEAAPPVNVSTPPTVVSAESSAAAAEPEPTREPDGIAKQQEQPSPETAGDINSGLSEDEAMRDTAERVFNPSNGSTDIKDVLDQPPPVELDASPDISAYAAESPTESKESERTNALAAEHELSKAAVSIIEAEPDQSDAAGKIDDEAELAAAYEVEDLSDKRPETDEPETADADARSETNEVSRDPGPVAESIAEEPDSAAAGPSAMIAEPASEPASGDASRPEGVTDAAPLDVDIVPGEKKDPPNTDNVTDPGTTPIIGTATTDGRKSGLKPLSEGTQLNGRYRISKKIGGGGMGAVYLAFDQNLNGTQRAVKEMVQSHIEEEAQAKAIEDFKRESMILSTLDHPSIPTIYDYFYDEAESRFYLVMKYISGGDLASRLRAAPEGRIDERTVTEWALQIIDVLDYLHSLPTTIVYRDLKPSNVMIDGNTGRIMLIDFGIARAINQNQEKGVTAVGTMGYAPPELFSGQVEPRSDIYSLGSTMFHLLTGADPQNNPLLIFDFQKNPRPRQINPRLSDQMERILMRAVEYNADARFASAADMRRTLHDHLENLMSGNVSYGITESPAAVSLANQSVFCGFCGQRIVAADLFCAFCGSKQPISQQGVHSEIYSHGNVTARLVIEGTSDLEAPAYPLDKNENLVGRRDPMSNIFPEVDLSKYDPQTKISRRHARIWREGHEFLVEDLGSSNGTLLLGRVSDTLRLSPHRPHPIANGDRLRIGDTTLQFIVG